MTLLPHQYQLLTKARIVGLKEAATIVRDAKQDAMADLIMIRVSEIENQLKETIQ